MRNVCRRRLPQATEIACLEVTQLVFLIQIILDIVFLCQFFVADVFHLTVRDMNQGQFARALTMTAAVNIT